MTFDQNDLDALAEALTPRLGEALRDYFSGVFEPLQHSEIMTTEEAADYLQVDVQTIRREVRNGRLPRLKVGRRYRFRKSDLLTSFEDAPQKPAVSTVCNRLEVALNN